MMNFKGKTAIITGAGQGIRLEICRHLIESGVNVVLNNIDSQLAADAVKALESEAGKCIAFPSDSSNLEVIRTLVDKTISEFGQLDIVIANAGITLFGDFLSKLFLQNSKLS